LKSKSPVDKPTVPHLSARHRVAIQGELGSNSHAAAVQVFGQASPDDLEIVPCALSAEVFERLRNGSVTTAVLPIENSLHGSVFEHYDLLLDHKVTVVGETLLRIRHNLIAAPGVDLSRLRRVLSHPVALSQCRRWLRAHPAIEAVPAYDTAGSVKQLMLAGSRDAAAIAPELAAVHYGAEILLRGVEDHPENYTRFYVLVPESKRYLSAQLPSGANKASLAFTLEHRPGSLLEALAIFHRTGLNLTRIESRPVPGRPWEYVFFVDLRYQLEDQLDRASEQLQATSQMVKPLGRFVAAELPL
jgi:prephenate dehydratase